MVRFLRDAFSGEKISKTYDTFEIQGFRLGLRPERTPPILVAALREGMLRLAAREADGAIINWLGPDDVPKVTAVLADAAGGEERELVARIFVCPSENAEVVRAGARYAIAAYMTQCTKLASRSTIDTAISTASTGTAVQLIAGATLASSHV